MFKNKIVLVLLLSLPLLLVTVLSVVIFGLQKYGTPAEYRAQQLAFQQAMEDSLRAVEAIESPENIADSTLFGMSVQSRIVSDTKEREKEIMRIQASIDSLNRLEHALRAREETIAARQEDLDQGIALFQDENAQKLATLYDNMKTNLAVPIFISMEDTLAVRILTFMEERNAARLLGALAEQDVNKATRLNKLLSMDEVGE